MARSMHVRSMPSTFTASKVKKLSQGTTRPKKNSRKGAASKQVLVSLT